MSIVDSQAGVFGPWPKHSPDLPERIARTWSAAIAHFAPHLRGAGAPPHRRAISWQAPGSWRRSPRRPHNIICVGKNYRAHAHEFTKSGFDAGAKAEDAIPEHPIIFTKPSSSIVGPDDAIPLWDGLDAAVDYEAELAVVIGRGGRAISRDRAFDACLRLYHPQ